MSKSFNNTWYLVKLKKFIGKEVVSVDKATESKRRAVVTGVTIDSDGIPVLALKGEMEELRFDKTSTDTIMVAKVAGKPGELWVSKVAIGMAQNYSGESYVTAVRRALPKRRFRQFSQSIRHP